MVILEHFSSPAPWDALSCKLKKSELHRSEPVDAWAPPWDCDFPAVAWGDKLSGWGGQSEQGFAPRLKDSFNLWSWDFTHAQSERSLALMLNELSLKNLFTDAVRGTFKAREPFTPSASLPVAQS